MVYRCFTEMKPGFDVEPQLLLRELREVLRVPAENLRIFRRYDVEGVSPEIFAAAKNVVFSEPQTGLCTDGLSAGADAWVLAVEALPGQFDQLADSGAQCIQMLAGGERPLLATAKVYALYGGLTAADRDKIRAYLINTIECREAAMEKPETLIYAAPPEQPESVVVGFTAMDGAALEGLLAELGLASDMADLEFIQSYFRDAELRDPTLTELKIIDTYWSDHCRHTTFNTHIDGIEISDPEVSKAFGEYQDARRAVYGEAAANRPVTLMDIATIGAKLLKKQGKLPNLDESEEVNACSVRIKANIDGEAENWLLMFKNETHNHPTEMEPFGGAATCVGGAIRDPLSGRAFVYQAMRVTGAGDPRTPVENTLPGKLPQRKLTRTAWAGNSSYGNQVGVPGGLAHEFYHEGYVAKRMEAGAIVAAAPAANVVRRVPVPGDNVLLIGGRTGRDGIGGATGSSKTQGEQALVESAAEVQKGNAPEERKLLRLFRKPEVARLIKRCNDFGAGGVSVAIGEMADGLDIDLDAVRVKYGGLSGGEIALSESQERMAVVVAPEDTPRILAEAEAENLEAYVVAKVTDKNRVVMTFKGEVIADISREFLASSGTDKHSAAAVPQLGVYQGAQFEGTPVERITAMAADLRFCAQRGIGERFDGSIGAGTVNASHGGQYGLTPVQAMSALLPAENGDSSTCSVMAFGFDPYHSSLNTFSAARDAVIVSCAKLVASGCDIGDVYLSFQEFFESLRGEPLRWGKPMSALLGALQAQLGLEVAAIGGKDSMSGSFMDIDVPPTLISFAVATCEAERVISPEFKSAANPVFLICPGETIEQTREIFKKFHSLRGNVHSAWAVTEGGAAEGVFKMAMGNSLGFEANVPAIEMLFGYMPGAIVAELSGISSVEVASALPGSILLGRTTMEPELRIGEESVSLDELKAIWEAPLEGVFPTRAGDTAPSQAISYEKRQTFTAAAKSAKPLALIPVLPGTNGEYDAALAVRRAGGEAQFAVLQNLTPEHLARSMENLVNAIKKAQMLILPGGFSSGDGDSSDVFFASFFRRGAVADAVNELIKKRDGLILGVGSGFRALVKLGLLPYGEIREPDENSPSLSLNPIGRHQAKYADVRISSLNSPWLGLCRLGEVYTLPVSATEGRFYAPEDTLKNLIANGQVAGQYVDKAGKPSMDISVNPTGSLMAVESIISPDGRVLGKAGHAERRGELVGLNVPGNKHQPIFEAGVAYFK